MSNSPENEDLIFSTQRLFNQANKKYNFYFYMLTFIECFKTKYIQKHLILFNPEKIEAWDKFPEQKIKKLNNILKILSKNPSKSLNLENTINESEYISIFYFTVLLFNKHFQKRNILEMFQDNKTLTYLSKKLIS